MKKLVIAMTAVLAAVSTAPVRDCLPEDEEDNDENFNVCGDLGPEGLTFVRAEQSPIGKALLIVSNEASSTTTIWQVE